MCPLLDCTCTRSRALLSAAATSLSSAAASAGGSASGSAGSESAAEREPARAMTRQRGKVVAYSSTSGCIAGSVPPPKPRMTTAAAAAKRSVGLATRSSRPPRTSTCGSENAEHMPSSPKVLAWRRSAAGVPIWCSAAIDCTNAPQSNACSPSALSLRTSSAHAASSASSRGGPSPSRSASMRRRSAGCASEAALRQSSGDCSSVAGGRRVPPLSKKSRHSSSVKSWSRWSS